MTFGRLATFLGILVVSLAAARQVLNRHAPRRPRVTVPTARALAVPSARPGARPPVGASGPPGLASGRAAEATSRQVDPLTDALCAEGMLLVDGTSCAETSHRCDAWDPASKDRCLRYAPAVCHKGLPLRFCIDRDEYPNQEGMLPAAMVTFEQAGSACEEEGKRLCTETEWALACEGETGLAFPYGDERDASACNVERKVPSVRPEELWEPRDVSAVLDRVDARTPSGGMPRCVSPFGVRDMTGNVEEWVQSDTQGMARALRGGEYSSDPTCLSVRKMRTEGFRQFHTGFRCCRDPLVRVPRRSPENATESARPVAPQGRFD